VKKTSRRPEPELFLNRELSWLEFNRRVLEEARDASTPPLERLKFAGIVASNLDEFFMVRVAALKNALAEGDTAPDLAGLTPAQQLRKISERAHAIVDELYEELHNRILPSSRPPRTTPTSWRSSRLCIAPAGTRRSFARSSERRRTASR